MIYLRNQFCFATSCILAAACEDARTLAARSYCPVNLSLEVFGDTWTLLILRDVMFAGKRHFRELLQSDEGISSNILADRLKRLVDKGILTKAGDPSHVFFTNSATTEK